MGDCEGSIEDSSDAHMKGNIRHTFPCGGFHVCGRIHSSPAGACAHGGHVAHVHMLLSMQKCNSFDTLDIHTRRMYHTWPDVRLADKGCTQASMHYFLIVVYD